MKVADAEHAYLSREVDYLDALPAIGKLACGVAQRLRVFGCRGHQEGDVAAS